MNSDARHLAGLVDAAARDAIQNALDRTLLVEAAAGTGKTTELVARVLQVILSGAGRLSSIALLTFTEKAAGEMKLRLRTELDRALSDPALPPSAQARARLALSELEAANIGTIHGFCAELLQRYPVEAGVDPSFEIVEAERERAVLHEVFDDWFARALQAPGEGVRRVLARREFAAHASPPRLDLMAAASRLIETRDFDTPYGLPDFDRARSLEALWSELESLAGLHVYGNAHDKLRLALLDLAKRLEQYRDLDLDQREAFLRTLVRERDAWPNTPGRGQLYASGLPRADVIARRDAARVALEDCVRLCDAQIAAHLSRELRSVVDTYAEAKTRAGLLDFFDLLLCTRRLLQECASVRRELQTAITHVFVDEFQDTDPVQSEIVLLLCADDPKVSDPWQTRPRPGKLFLVGDPKQSIYRFRRADIALYERIKHYLLARGGELVQLTTSFRALPDIQACVNAAFAPVMGGQPGQADYVPLTAFRAPRSEQPAIVALPVPSPYGYSGRVTKRALQTGLPHAIAAWLEWLLKHSNFRVREHGRDVPVSARHVCLLFRRFRNYDGDVTRAYIHALETRRLPHVISGGGSFHTREEVIAVRNLLTAIEWPDDLLHVYATLRGPLCGFHDETLFAFKEHIGHLHPLRPIEDDQLGSDDERAVAELLALLGTLHRARNRVPIAHTLARFVSAVRAHAGLAVWPNAEQALANLRKVMDSARSYERRGKASSFRGFVESLIERAREAYSAEAPVIEERSDGIRLMTVHAAKGLEFPVVVLCDPTAPARHPYPSHFIDPERRLWAQSLCDCQPIELWERREQVREHDAAEVVRVLYVAATRAQELLVVPACGDGPIEGWLDVLSDAIYPPQERCRSPLPPSYALPAFGSDSVVSRMQPMPSYSVAPGEHLPVRGEQRVVFWDPHLFDGAPLAPQGVAQMHLLQAADGGPHAELGQQNYAAFLRQRAELRTRAAAPSLESSSITLRADSELIPTATGTFELIEVGRDRAARPHGARFGSLVHALFERCDVSTAAVDSAALARLARAIGRGLGADASEIEAAKACVAHALAHPFFERVRAAAQQDQVYREVPVVVRSSDGVLLDGVIDLAFVEAVQGAQQLCIVDFKTDLELTRLSHYQRQLGMYAEAATSALGISATCVLLWV